MNTLEYQREHKPLIEEAIPHLIAPERQQIALDFVAWLRENNFKPRWASHNQWRAAGKKSKVIFLITIGGSKHKWSKLEEGDWQISELEGIERKYLDEFASCDEIKEFVWANITPCNKCSACGPRNRVYIGKQFCECCGFRIVNPNEKDIEISKKILLSNRQYIHDNM